MDDATRVRVRERVDHVMQDVHGLRHGDRADGGDLRAQRFALDEGHRVVRRPRRIAGGEHGDDVRMLKACDELDLATKALGADAAGEVVGKELHDDAPVEGPFPRDEDAAHATASELVLDEVRLPE